MVKLKIGRNILDIDENDLILDNGACYQIDTKTIGFGFIKSIPVMSKKIFNNLKKCDLIFTSDELRQAAIDRYGSLIVTFWKFNMDQMQKMGY